MIKRYSIKSGFVIENENGDYVKYENNEAIQESLAALMKQLGLNSITSHRIDNKTYTVYNEKNIECDHCKDLKHQLNRVTKELQRYHKKFGELRLSKKGNIK